MKKILPLLFLISLSAASCSRPSDSPEMVVKHYFEAVADADFDTVKTCLTPDGLDLFRDLESEPELKEQLRSGRDAQRVFWKGARTETLPAAVDGDRAVVPFRAGFNGKSVTMPVILHRINGEWKISSYSFSGVPAIRFREELAKIRSDVATAAVPEATAAVPEAAPAH